MVTPWTQFTGDNFSRNLPTVIAFVPDSQETIFCEINSSLPVSAGWNTCCAMVSHARRSFDTSIVSQSRVRLIQCQCKSRLQITNLGINNAFLAATKQLYEWFSPSVCPSVCPSVRPSVTPFWLCSHHPIIMKFSGVITSDKSDVHAKGQGQRSKVKVTEVTTQIFVSGL